MGSGVGAVEAMLSPVVMVSSCAILANGLLSLYGSISDRMRAMTKERLDLLGGAADRRGDERLGEIDVELRLLLPRHRLLHNALLVLYSAVPLVVASMFLIGLAEGLGWGWAGWTALFALLAATAMLLGALGFAAVAVRRSQDAVVYEVQRVLSVPRPEP